MRDARFMTRPPEKLDLSTARVHVLTRLHCTDSQVRRNRDDDVDVGCSLRIHHHDHACSFGVHARQQCRCLHELLLHSIIACFESATILISTIACYCLHASCMLLRPSSVWRRVVISLPDLPGYCGRRTFRDFPSYGRGLSNCRFSRCVLGGLI